MDSLGYFFGLLEFLGYQNAIFLQIMVYFGKLASRDTSTRYHGVGQCAKPFWAQTFWSMYSRSLMRKRKNKIELGLEPNKDWRRRGQCISWGIWDKVVKESVAKGLSFMCDRIQGKQEAWRSTLRLATAGSCGHPSQMGQGREQVLGPRREQWLHCYCSKGLSQKSDVLSHRSVATANPQRSREVARWPQPHCAPNFDLLPGFPLAEPTWKPEEAHWSRLNSGLPGHWAGGRRVGRLWMGTLGHLAGTALDRGMDIFKSGSEGWGKDGLKKKTLKMVRKRNHNSNPVFWPL